MEELSTERNAAHKAGPNSLCSARKQNTALHLTTVWSRMLEDTHRESSADLIPESIPQARKTSSVNLGEESGRHVPPSSPAPPSLEMEGV